MCDLSKGASAGVLNTNASERIDTLGFLACIGCHSLDFIEDPDRFRGETRPGRSL